MAIFIMLLAAVFAATANLFMRKSIDAGGSPKAFLVLQQGVSIFMAILLNPVYNSDYTWDTPIASIGLLGGFILGLMMWLLGRALQKGPPGLTFAVLNSAMIMPAVVMFLLFGFAFGHGYTLWNAFGSSCVLIGLFWAGMGSSQYINKKQWFFACFAMFFVHICYLVLLQWRALLMKDCYEATALIPFQATTQWFLPMVFVASTIFQISIFFFSPGKRSVPNKKEVLYGVLGGMFNAGCAFSMVKATEVAASWENAMIFPIFAVTVIASCNLWGQLLYRENVNWRASFLCIGGLIVGTVQWQCIFN